jgi:hypothetical protein
MKQQEKGGGGGWVLVTALVCASLI